MGSYTIFKFDGTYQRFASQVFLSLTSDKNTCINLQSCKFLYLLWDMIDEKVVSITEQCKKLKKKPTLSSRRNYFVKSG